MSKYGHRPGNWLEAIVNKVGGEEKADRLLRGELRVVEANVKREPIPWCLDVDGTIRMSFMTDDCVEKDWVTRLERRGVSPCDCTKKIFQSGDFIRTPHTTQEVVVLRASSYKQELTTKKVCSIGKKEGLSGPHPDVACYVAERLRMMDLKAMGLDSIVFMHSPIIVDGHAWLLEFGKREAGCVLTVRSGGMHQELNTSRGFVFMLEWPPAQ